MLTCGGGFFLILITLITIVPKILRGRSKNFSKSPHGLCMPPQAGNVCKSIAKFRLQCISVGTCSSQLCRIFSGEFKIPKPYVVQYVHALLCNFLEQKMHSKFLQAYMQKLFQTHQYQIQLVIFRCHWQVLHVLKVVITSCSCNQ